MDSIAPEILDRVRARVGQVIRRKYRVDSLLGVGGMASVFAVTHRNGSRAALKVLHPELAQSADIRSRFLREGYVANRIDHPGVVRIIDDDDDDEFKTVFLVMELLDGETVADRIVRSGGRLAVDHARDIADRALDVLAAAHDEGVVHRDIKPENLFLTRSDELKVLDFGIARVLDGTGGTRTGQLLGTPAFMSPEQAGGRVREIDARTDLWAVCALLFNLLSGSYVHDSQHAMALLVYAATQPARPIESVAPSLPPGLAAVVNRALELDREKRWPSARAMQSALRGKSSGAAQRARPVLEIGVKAQTLIQGSGDPET